MISSSVSFNQVFEIVSTLNNKRCFQHGIHSSSNRETPAPSSPSARKVWRVKLNRTQPPLLVRDLKPIILNPILNNKMGLQESRRAMDPRSCPGWLIFTIKGDATTSTWLLSCITRSPPSCFPSLNLAEKSHQIRLWGQRPTGCVGRGSSPLAHISAIDGSAQDFCHRSL